MMTDNNFITASGTDCPFGAHYQRYWQLLSPLEQQMQMDTEGLYSLDLQAVLAPLAKEVRAARVVDAFCGIGGAAIAFALAGKEVEAIECDATRLEMARHNARLFNVQAHISFRHGDAMQLLATPMEAAVYLDPPWGGPVYADFPRFPLDGFNPDGTTMLLQALRLFPEVLFKMPKNIDLAALQRVAMPSLIFSNTLDGNLQYYTAIFRQG